MAVVETSRPAQDTAEAALKDTQPTVPCVFHHCSSDFDKPSRHTPSAAVTQMDNMGWTIPIPGLPGHLLALRHPESWAAGQDWDRHTAPEFLGPADHPTILPSCSAHIRVAHLLLRLPVSVSIYCSCPEILTNCNRFIPSEYRSPIWVKVLPALENIFYGANLSNILSEHKHTVLDVLAWLPYGIIHFGGPFVAAGLMFIFAPPSFLPVFGKAFGYVNLIGVIIQVLFPCSAPWYENLYGLAPANYSIKGEPAGLAAIDKLFGVDLYTSTFTVSPMVFGAFPSLHSGNATIEMLFMSYVFPKLTPLFVGYVFWLWWATMYLSHHYAVDLVAGSLLSGVIFFFAKAHFMPRLQPDKMFRWDYDFIEIGEAPMEYGYEGVDGAHADSDEWTIGSSSSISSGSLSPVDDSQHLWEGQSTIEKP